MYMSEGRPRKHQKATLQEQTTGQTFITFNYSDKQPISRAAAHLKNSDVDVHILSIQLGQVHNLNAHLRPVDVSNH